MNGIYTRAFAFYFIFTRCNPWNSISIPFPVAGKRCPVDAFRSKNRQYYSIARQNIFFAFTYVEVTVAPRGITVQTAWIVWEFELRLFGWSKKKVRREVIDHLRRAFPKLTLLCFCPHCPAVYAFRTSASHASSYPFVRIQAL